MMSGMFGIKQGDCPALLLGSFQGFYFATKAKGHEDERPD